MDPRFACCRRYRPTLALAFLDVDLVMNLCWEALNGRENRRIRCSVAPLPSRHRMPTQGFYSTTKKLGSHPPPPPPPVFLGPLSSYRCRAGGLGLAGSQAGWGVYRRNAWWHDSYRAAEVSPTRRAGARGTSRHPFIGTSQSKQTINLPVISFTAAIYRGDAEQKTITWYLALLS